MIGGQQALQVADGRPLAGQLFLQQLHLRVHILQLCSDLEGGRAGEFERLGQQKAKGNEAGACWGLTRSTSMLLAVSWRAVSSLPESSLTHSSLTEARSERRAVFSSWDLCSSSSSRDMARVREETWPSYACRAWMCFRERVRTQSLSMHL